MAIRMNILGDTSGFDEQYDAQVVEPEKALEDYFEAEAKEANSQ